MKTLTFLVSLVIFIQIVKDVKSKIVDEATYFKPQEETCISELNLDRDHIKLLNSKDITPENSLEFNTFINCYWGKMGWQGSDGKINFNSLKESLQDQITQSVETENPAAITLLKQMVAGAVEECERTTPYEAEDHGEIAAKVQNCIITILHELMKDHVSLISRLL